MAGRSLEAADGLELARASPLAFIYTRCCRCLKVLHTCTCDTHMASHRPPYVCKMHHPFAQKDCRATDENLIAADERSSLPKGESLPSL